MSTLELPAVLGAMARVPRHVVYRALVTETVILNLETGRYHGVNATGARVLDTLDREQSVRAAVERLAREYERPEEELARDVADFCRDLQERGLIELHPNGRR